LSLRTDIDPTRNNELSSTIIAKYKNNNKQSVELSVLAMINKKTDKKLVVSSWKNRD